MARRPNAPTYAELFRAIEQSQLILVEVVQLRMAAPARERLLMLMHSQARLLYRDNGRGRQRRPPRAAPVEVADSARIS
jgi:hypothetical protein